MTIARTRTQTVIPAGELVAQARQHAGAELDQLAAASARLTQLTMSIGVQNSMDDVVNALATQLAEDAVNDTVTADHPDRISAAIQEHASRTHRVRVLSQAQSIIRSRITETTRGVADAGLRYLHASLVDLLSRADTAEPDWLTQQYREIRLAQRVLTADARGRGGDLRDLHVAGITRIPTDVTYQTEVGLIVPRIDMMSGKPSSFIPEPWPFPVLEGNDLVPSTDPIAYLRWLAERGDAWVPTSGELEAALKVRQRAIRSRTPVEELADAADQERAHRARTIKVTNGSVAVDPDLRRDLARRRDPEWP